MRVLTVMRVCQFIYVLAAALLCANLSPAQEAPAVSAPSQESPEQRDARMKWWRDAKFGMFIHYGVFSQFKTGEWCMSFQDYTKAEYEEYKEKGIVQGGMIPKLDNAFNALACGVKQVIITQADRLLSGVGTRIII